MSGPRHRSVPVVIAALLLAGCGGGSRVRMTVSPAVSLWDAPVRLAISGLKPHQRVAVRASGRAVALVADASGRVEVSGAASRRLLWLLEPGVPGGGGTELTITAAGAHVALTRLPRARGVRLLLLRPGRDGFYGDFYAPARARHRPGILVFGGSEGGLSIYPKEMAALFASHGYPSLALAYFHEPGLPANLVRIPLEYFVKALRWLARQPGVDAHDLVADGVSRGSEAAQLLGIHYPRLVRAVIAMVPGSGSACGITPFSGAVGSAHCLGAAWTVGDKPVPYVRFSGPANPYPFHDERIDGPVLLDCGGFDELWLSCPMARVIASRLLAHRFRHRVTLLYYPRAGHGVGPLLPAPPGLTFLDGATADANITADANGWPRLLRFLAAVADS